MICGRVDGHVLVVVDVQLHVRNLRHQRSTQANALAVYAGLGATMQGHVRRRWIKKKRGMRQLLIEVDTATRPWSRRRVRRTALSL